LGIRRSHKEQGLARTGDVEVQKFFFQLKNVELKMHCELEHCLGEEPSRFSIDLVASF